MEPSTSNRNWILPASIVFAALIVSGSLVWSAGSKRAEPLGANLEEAAQGAQASVARIEAVTESDHIFGEKNAPVKIVEFSDLECPFCKKFHETMKQIVGEYKGKVAWVYRHFPLDSLHTKARKEAEAAECATELGGNDAFWKYLDGVFAVTPSNDRLDLNELPLIAERIGLSKSAFTSCLESGKYASLVAKHLADAEAGGGTGTPFSVIIAPDGTRYAVEGALPFSEMKRIVDRVLE
jgi:protein-disulfide isomerase